MDILASSKVTTVISCLSVCLLYFTIRMKLNSAKIELNELFNIKDCEGYDKFKTTNLALSIASLSLTFIMIISFIVSNSIAVFVFWTIVWGIISITQCVFMRSIYKHFDDPKIKYYWSSTSVLCTAFLLLFILRVIYYVAVILVHR